MAFPQSPMMRMDAPIFVNLPSPSSAKGQMPAQMSEFAKPNKTTNQILISAFMPANATFPWLAKMPQLNNSPRQVQKRRAFTWLIRRGIEMIPMMYPQIVAAKVKEGKTFASIKPICIEPA